jgi:hypothetical protein
MARPSRPAVNRRREAFIEIDKRLAAMDAQAVDVEVLSIKPFGTAATATSRPDRQAPEQKLADCAPASPTASPPSLAHPAAPDWRSPTRDRGQEQA